MALYSGLVIIFSLLLVFVSHYFLQLTQNNFSWQLANKFIFEWHTEKFLLASVVLLTLLILCQSFVGSIWIGSLIYSVLIILLGMANFMKMFYREEPLYPDDLKMVTEVKLLSEMAGGKVIVFSGLLILGIIILTIWQLYRSRLLTKKRQIWRIVALFLSIISLSYISQFNNEKNLLRQAFNRTAHWIPYSQKMNYYNTGFVGGFLYNLAIDPMAQPAGYSKSAINKITENYLSSEHKKLTDEDKPNVVYIMSESFSDPSRLNGIDLKSNPIAPYQKMARETYSGRMLSQNYGGGTANIEFEALTSLSMELLNSQLTTPYTMLVPKLKELPSIVSILKENGYATTAIHPYNTSMYKRKDVYQKLGFDQFISEDTMEHKEKIMDNKYISDESAFNEVLDQLSEKDTSQFVHLVTMQTHMPYGQKYGIKEPLLDGVESPLAISSYITDIGYTSEALQSFLEKIKKLERRTVVVFWGDHLPSTYGDDIKAKNTPEVLHQTEFSFFDSQEKFENKGPNQVLSPVYFGPKLFDMAGLPQTGFYQLLNQLALYLPAFEKEMYYQDNQWHQTMKLSSELEQLYADYKLIQYDLVAGKQYSLKNNFY